MIVMTRRSCVMFDCNDFLCKEAVAIGDCCCFYCDSVVPHSAETCR